MSKPATIVSSVVVAAFLSGLATPAAAQMMGGYNFPARNPGLAAQYQYLRQQSNNGGTVQSGGIGALNQYVNTYTTNSQSVGNMHTVTVGDNSDATVMSNATQDSDGSQTSDADSEITIDNSMTDSGNVNIGAEEAGQMADILEGTLE